MSFREGIYHDLRLPKFDGEEEEEYDDERVRVEGDNNTTTHSSDLIRTVDVIGILNSPCEAETHHSVPWHEYHSSSPTTPPPMSSDDLIRSPDPMNGSPKFPTTEVTVDSSSQDSVDLTYSPMSPLTPYSGHPENQLNLNGKVSNRDLGVKKSLNESRSRSSSINLENLLNKMASKKKGIMDVADHSPPMKKTRDGTGVNHFRMTSVDSDSDDADSVNTNPTHNYSRRKIYDRTKQNPNALSPRSNSSYIRQEQLYSQFPAPPVSRKEPQDPTVHAQSFVLALAFFAAWSPSNLMAPNLTQMADFFHFSPEQRDLYLGANIALATGVLSLPLQGMLGFMADAVSSRKQLFAYTVICGGITAIWTGSSTTYAQLFFARFLCGGCMSGSLPIAFSILGDFFDAKDRNAASSGLTAMMGAGILFGQVYAGMVGDISGWQHPFYVSGILSIITGLMVMKFVKEPIRGGKEAVLQKLLATGSSYDRKLTKDGFIHAMTKNKTNIILMLQGFMTSLPWGIIFVFFNDYLSQEQGLSVSAATFVVLWFGLGSAAGGIAGGLIGSRIIRINRSYLPLFMAASTLLGTIPFILLLDLKFSQANLLAVFLSFSGGCIANFPSVNVRPCLLNVNPPEARGAAVTAANVIINVARGAGPSLITLSRKFYGVTRQYSFNFCLVVFWSLTSILLAASAKTLPHDQDEMEAELAQYAASIIEIGGRKKMTQVEDKDKNESMLFVDDNTIANDTIVSFDDRMTSFDATAAQESWTFMEDALREIVVLSHLRVANKPKYKVISNDESHEVVMESVREDGNSERSHSGIHNLLCDESAGFEEERL